MIWISKDKIFLESFEPDTHVCWECGICPYEKKFNNVLTVCPLCGREWIFGKFLDNFENIEEFINWLKELGIEKYKSTTEYEIEF